MVRYFEKTAFSFLLALTLLLFSCNTSSSSIGGNAMTEDAAGAEQAENQAEKPGQPGMETPAENAAAVLDSLYTETGDSKEALSALDESDVDSMYDESRLVYAVLLRDQ